MTEHPKLIKRSHELYYAAIAADDAFHAAVVAQFGEKNAGDMRYHSGEFNAQTRAASIVKQNADEAYRLATMHAYAAMPNDA